MEEPFACPAAPCSIIIIKDTPVGSPPPISPAPTPPPSPCVPPPSHCRQEPNRLLPPAPSSSHSCDDTRQEFTNL
ncbi:hypothetical protein O181_084524 [Austropuccinia psidii MF-1]|uniref:Uncharacterized protein n=1 Tax=Austropuccinia psidii MF-1 TaxID=1389203 RepID=A0A9Q3IMM5_9BASI|nr:hypothetical protein [Austropuccinia psidii MF-1]